jgi:DNA-directed RNA polymerase subunit RPC12/RpoP
MLAVRFSTLERTIKQRKPVRDEWGYKRKYRCRPCSRAFDGREVEKAYWREREETGCPQCGSTDWGDNDELIKARAIRRWSIKPIHFRSAA